MSHEYSGMTLSVMTGGELLTSTGANIPLWPMDSPTSDSSLVAFFWV